MPHFICVRLCRRVHVHLMHGSAATFFLLPVRELVSPMDHPNSRTKWTSVGLTERRWPQSCLSDLRKSVQCRVALLWSHVVILAGYTYSDVIQVFYSHTCWFRSTPATGKSFFPIAISYSLRNMCPLLAATHCEPNSPLCSGDPVSWKNGFALDSV